MRDDTVRMKIAEDYKNMDINIDGLDLSFYSYCNKNYRRINRSMMPDFFFLPFYYISRGKYSPRFFFTRRFLPLDADFRITTPADRSRRHHIPVVTIAGICVQRQYIVAVNVADDRRQHYGKNPRSDFSRRSNDDN